MATDIKLFSQTDVDNSDIGMEEGMARSSVNNDARLIMASLRSHLEDPEWLELTQESLGSFSYAKVSSYVFNVIDGTGTDASGKFPVGTWVKVWGAGFAVYGSITNSVYSSPNTTVTLAAPLILENWSTTSTIQAAITFIYTYSNRRVRDAAFHPVGITTGEAPQEIPTIDLLGDGALVDEAALDGGKLDGIEASSFQLVGANTRNVIQNGGMQIWQRGLLFEQNSLEDEDMVADRFAFLESEPNSWSVERASLPSFAPPGFRHSMKITARNATGKCGILQVISLDNSRPIFANTKASLSFWVLLPTAGSISSIRANILTSTLTADSTDRGCVNVWGGDGVDPTYTNWTSQVGTPASFQHVPDGAWTRVTIENISVPSVNNLGVFIYCPDSSHLAGDSFYITGIQIEPGGVSSSYIHKLWHQEYWSCLPYFQKTYNLEVTPGSNSSAGVIINILSESVAIAALRCVAEWSFSGGMRALPTISIYHPTSGASDFAGDSDVSLPTDVKDTSTKNTTFRVTSAVNQNDVIGWHATAEAEISS